LVYQEFRQDVVVKMSLEELIKLHNCAINNKKDIDKSDTCGCFYCKKIFYSGDITEWTDEGQTAICPHCGVDSVICNKKNYEVTLEDLNVLNKYYFPEINK
jgi:hypothetical protein